MASVPVLDEATLRQLRSGKAEVDAVVRDLRVVLWSDIMPLLGDFEPREVRHELLRRCPMPDASF